MEEEPESSSGEARSIALQLIEDTRIDPVLTVTESEFEARRQRKDLRQVEDVRAVRARDCD